MTDYSKLTNEEINIAVAERVMGWTLQRAVSAYDPHMPIWWHGGEIAYADWKPSTDDNDIRFVRAEIERRGLQGSFLYFLRHTGAPTDWLWDVVDAKPRRQSIAALKSVEENAS